ncbi:Protein kinase, ATP binding site [Nannochloropsis gaditana]|uniref:Protein kinase, ATP binding site n=1 Tax=Nannochloropsis gaditana TaxID=72520 RepID=W7TIV2_9STRA|nr:Protein kinase, ATP binding site [Nannochloropsis gaditana]
MVQTYELRSYDGVGILRGRDGQIFARVPSACLDTSQNIPRLYKALGRAIKVQLWGLVSLVSSGSGHALPPRGSSPSPLPSDGPSLLPPLQPPSRNTSGGSSHGAKGVWEGSWEEGRRRSSSHGSHSSSVGSVVSNPSPRGQGGRLDGGRGKGGGGGRGGFHARYELCDVIGVGSTSTVHRCVERGGEGREFACKIIDKRMVESRFRGLLEQFQIEVAVLKALDHPNIIRLEDVFETEHRIYMVMELMRGGELFDRVVERGSLSEEEASEVVRALASAIAYMHSMGIIHRDLKPENLLLSHGGAGPGGVGQAVKIIDFGLSKMVGGAMAQSFLGTRG